MEKKFTQGEWFVNPEHPNEIRTEDLGLIVTCYPEIYVPEYYTDQVKANAKLIAAAPYMYEALYQLAEELDKLSIDGNSIEFRLWKIANDALKKATE